MGRIYTASHIPSSGGFADPKDIAGLVAWFRADIGITLNGNNVSLWSDQSGKGNHVTQATGSAQPAFVNNAYNGKPCVRFVAANSQYLSRAATNLFGSGPYTIVETLKNNTLPSGFTGHAGSTNTSAGVAIGTNSNIRNDLIFGLEAFALNAGNASTTTQETYMAWRPAASNHKGTFNNGAVLTSGTAALNDPGVGAALILGAHLNSGSVGGFADFDLLEVAMYNVVLTTAQITGIGQYMGVRYGIAE
jgi:hypothetical protein